MIASDPLPSEAAFYETLADGRAHCTLCPHSCRIADGYLGACGVRVNHRGVLFTLVRDRVACRQVDPIEKKPLFHFLPGSSAYSIATVGCPLQCPFCQNWELSQWPRERLPRRVRWECTGPPWRVCARLAELADRIPGAAIAPASLVAEALEASCESVAYTYSEPVAFYELVRDTALLARRAGLRNVLVTSGFCDPRALGALAPFVDAANVDLKFFRPVSYARFSKARLAPVLEAIRLLRASGVWVEVTTLVVPGLNDSDAELEAIAGFVRSVGADVPWHVTRFHPAHRIPDAVPTPVETVRRARRIGLAAGLRHVYTGNLPGDEGLDTACPGCGKRLVSRPSLRAVASRLRDGACPDCGARVAGVWAAPAS